MKGTNPILPPGMNFEGAQRGRSNMRMAVVVVVLLHVAFFTVILFQACSKTEKKEDAKPTLAQEMEQIVNQPQPSPTTTPSTQPLQPLPNNEGAAFPPLPTTPIAPPTGLPPDPATFGTTPPSLPPTTPPVAPPPALAVAGSQHTVASGENFWTLSKKYGVRHKDIVAANPTVIATRMKIGQKINIPPKPAAPAAPTPPPAAANDPTTYTVKSGDTLGHIALRHKVKLKVLQALNPNVIPTQMKIGQKLKLPASTTVVSPGSVTGLNTAPSVDSATGLPVLPTR